MCISALTPEEVWDQFTPFRCQDEHCDSRRKDKPGRILGSVLCLSKDTLVMVRVRCHSCGRLNLYKIVD